MNSNMLSKIFLNFAWISKLKLFITSKKYSGNASAICDVYNRGTVTVCLIIIEQSHGIQ